jgi:DNA-binding transcriptional LysR family regulator
MPASIDDLVRHVCLPSHNGEPWKLEGPDGEVIYRPEGPLHSNSSEVLREAVISGMGIALRSTWDIGPELASGKLVRVLPDYSGSRDVGIYAIYSSRQFLPPKIRLFIDFLANLYGPAPYWENGEKAPHPGANGNSALPGARKVFATAGSK